MAKTINIKMSNLGGIAPNTLCDCVDNNGYYICQRLTGTQLLTGLTVSVADNTTSVVCSSTPQSATWSSLNPYNPGVNAPSVPSFMKFDTVNKGSGVVLSNGNLTADISSQGIAIGDTFHSGSGKYYCEITATYPTLTLIGFIASTYAAVNLNRALGVDPVGWGLDLYGLGPVYNNNTSIRSVMTSGIQGSGYTYLMAFDAAAGNFYCGIKYGATVYWYNTTGNSTNFASASPLNTSPVTGSFTIGCGYGAAGTETLTINTGQSAYVSTPPSGYTNW